MLRCQASGGQLTEVALKPPESLEEFGGQELKAALEALADTSAVTGIPLFRLLALKLNLPFDCKVKAFHRCASNNFFP